MSAPSAGAAADDEEYEICNDDGFVYKRRRGLYLDVAPPSAQSTGPGPEAGRRRRRRDALLRLRDKRLRELDRWEALERKLDALLPALRPPPPQATPASPCAAAAPLSSSASVLDDLLARAKVEEAILKKVAGLCDEVDALCRAHEEDAVDAITTLPVWGDPKELLLSLQSLDEPVDINSIKVYQNEGIGGFHRPESKQDRCAIEARAYDGLQEAPGMPPVAVQNIERVKTLKRASYQCKTPNGLGDGPLNLTENRKKKRIASPSGSRSAYKPKRICQSTSPNPISFSSGPTTRRAAAAKLHK